MKTTIYEIRVYNNNFMEHDSMNHDRNYTSDELENHFYGEAMYQWINDMYPCETWEKAQEIFKRECDKASSSIKGTSGQVKYDCVELISIEVDSFQEYVEDGAYYDESIEETYIEPICEE